MDPRWPASQVVGDQTATLAGSHINRLGSRKGGVGYLEEWTSLRMAERSETIDAPAPHRGAARSNAIGSELSAHSRRSALAGAYFS